MEDSVSMCCEYFVAEGTSRIVRLLNISFRFVDFVCGFISFQDSENNGTELAVVM
jgi:hypothetical protein